MNKLLEVLYERKNTADYVSYIRHGWAVASPYEFKNEYNGTLRRADRMSLQVRITELAISRDVRKEVQSWDVYILFVMDRLYGM